jgi:single-stranded-DNA-specific exonuclease
VKFRWNIAAPEPLLAGDIARKLGIPVLLAQCLLNRGHSVPERITHFLEPRLKNLSDPFLLPDMAVAVERLFQARENKEPVVIFGDYDVDGVTSTALLLEVLKRLGWAAEYYLPNRMDEGYGLSREAVANCLHRYPASLLLAVDCGSTAVDCVQSLKREGTDVIVLDHHQAGPELPPAVALVNPQVHPTASNVESHATDFRELCSVGLAFKLAHALVKRGRECGLTEALNFDVRPLLDLVALGTIADLVPLTGENRILVSAGLERLNQTQRPGLKALKRVSQCREPLGVYEVGFQLGPRLNAAGRMETAEDALRLLIAANETTALPLAMGLDARNRERQDIERMIAAQAIEVTRSSFDPKQDFAIVQGNADWHIGVVGIVASKVLQQFYRPTIIVGGDGGLFRGSGRSIPGFDLAAALSQCCDLLLRHGGHAMAAGVTLEPARLEAFRQEFNEIARQQLSPESLQPCLRLDGEVRLSDLDLDGLQLLDQLRPMGQGNPAVQFCARNVAHRRPLQRMGASKQHVKMWVTDGADSLEAVWWGAGNESLPVGQFDLAFAPSINRFNGNATVQLKVLDWRPATSS